MLHIEITKLLKTEQGRKDLNIVMDVERGETVGLKGVTGSGKTTLLEIISGLTEPDSGELSCNEVIWWQKSPGRNTPAWKRGIGYCMQQGVIYNHMNVCKNMLFAGAAVEEAHELLDRIGLYAFRNTYPHTLSGGQKQRLLIARALIKKTSLLLFDEPFSALDEETAWRMADLIKEYQSVFSASLILVSHHAALVSAFVDRFYVIETGCCFGQDEGRKKTLCHGMQRVAALSKSRKK